MRNPRARSSQRAVTIQTAGTLPGLRPIAAVCAGLMTGMAVTQAPAYAQQAAEAQTVVVTGIRAGIESSISQKRNSDSIVEAISAEDIGKLPDISIAEAMSRMPGLAAQRVDGRAQVIAVRGMSPDFAGTILNGREQASTGSNRGVEFDQYPAELMSSVLVYKTPDATLVGQGLSGTVDLNTVRPLAFHERNVVFNARAEHNSLGDLNHGYGGTSANGGRFSASYIDQFADRTIGLAIGYAHLDAPGQQLNYQAWGWQTDENCLAHQNDWGCHPITGNNPGKNYYLAGFQAEASSRHEKRDGLMAALEYKPSPDLHSTLDLYYSQFRQTEVMRGLMGSLGDGWGIPGSTFSNLGTTNVGDQVLVTSATANFVPNVVVRNDENHRKDELKSAGWNIDKRIGAWHAVADLSYSSASRDESLFETYAGPATSPTMTYTTGTGPGFPNFAFASSMADPGTIQLTDPAGWGHVGRLQHNLQKDVIKGYRVHAIRELEWGPINSVDFGVNLTRRDKTRDFNVFFASLNNSALRTPLAASYVMTPTSLGYVGIPGVLSYDVNAVAANYYTMTRNMSGGTGGDYAKDFGVHEKITTSFVKFDIDSNVGGIPVRGNAGVQYVHSEQDSNAFAFNSAGAIIGTIDPGTSYNDVLPSLNLGADIAPDRKLRLGIAKTMARPRIDDMNASSSAGVSTNDHTWSGGGGNPKLQPWRAKSFDISLERYIGKRSYVAGAFFFKKLDSYIYQSTIPYDFTGFINATPTVTPASNIGTYSTQTNGSGGNMRGVELSAALEGSLLSDALSGWGMIGTASFTDSSINVNGPDKTSSWQTLPGLSKRVAGLTIYYETGPYSFRINDRYRSDYRGEFNSLFGATSFVRTLASNQIDVQASYEIQSGSAKGLQLLLQVVNIANAPDRNIQDGSGFGGVAAPREYDRYGRQILLGVNYKFH